MNRKLFKPKLLLRRRIIETLEGIFQVPLFLLLSSMGYGKTTAVREFLKARKNIRYIWFSLSYEDSDEMWLWQKFCHSLAGQSPELSRRLAGYGLPKTSADIDRILDIVEGAVKKTTVVVLDDYHENRSRYVNRLITAFAGAAIAHLHIVLISRSLPEIPFDELALKGMCRELSQDRFEFSKEETVELFACNGFLLDREEQALLYKNTDGWTAAIYLALLKYIEDKTVGDMRDVTRLIKTAVYDKLDRDTQKTLLKLSLLDSFSLNGAIFVTGNNKAGQLIHGLAANNCFIRYDNKSETYALHAILRSMLQEQLAVSDLDKPHLFSLCGDWYARCDRPIEAIDFYHRAGRYEKILDMFELPGSAELMDKAPQIIISAFNDMDKALKLSRPLAYITYVYSYLVAVDALEGARLLYEAKVVYETDESLPDREQILGEIALAESFLQFNDVSLMTRYHKKACTLMGGASSRISNPQAVFTFGSPHTLYLYHRDAGKLFSLVEMIESNIEYYTHVSNGCGTGFEHTARAEYCMETGDLANAEFFAQKAIYKAKTRNQWSLSICGNMCLARLAVLNGKPREACAILETLQAEKEVTGRPILQNGADIAAGYIYGCLGKLGKIPQWLREGDLSRCNLFYQGMGINYIIIGKAAILRKNYAQLEVIVETMREIYKPNNHVFGLIYTGIYEAIAKNRLHGPERAGEALLYAVKLAMADGIITPFAENMPELDPVFQWIRWDGDGEWTDKVLHLGGRFMKAVEKMDKENDIQPLTEREKDVINLLEEGCKQKEIAERLCLSPNTVRRHLQNAYGKLGVNNVTQAIKKVRELTS